MSRDYEYINVSKPGIRSAGLSHDLQLQRDLEIVNARTAAELGPLPSGVLPVVPKRNHAPSQSTAMSEYGITTFENQEEAMKVSQVVAITALAAGMTACEPSRETVAAEQTQIMAPAVKQAVFVASEVHAEPIVAAVSERAATDAVPAVPDEIRAFVPQDSTLLAYRRFDLTGDGNEDAVLIVRHPIAEGTHSDFQKNPCDLIVLHGEASGFKIAAKSSKIVDCTYKLYARESASKPDSLNSILELKSGEIALTQEKDRPTGINTYYWFRYSNKNSVWYLSEAEATYISYDIIGGTGRKYFANEKVRYPTDIRFIDIDSFDPDDLTEA